MGLEYYNKFINSNYKNHNIWYQQNNYVLFFFSSFQEITSYGRLEVAYLLGNNAIIFIISSRESSNNSN